MRPPTSMKCSVCCGAAVLRDGRELTERVLLSERMKFMSCRLLAVLMVTLLAAGQSVLAQADSVWVIPVEGEINPATAQYIRSRIERANEERPLAILFELDTPGGLVTAMETIVDDILTRAEVPTLAVVRNAFSAGALIAMSAQQLAMLPGSAIGAAMPVGISPVGTVSAVDAKTTSAMRGLFRSVAEARGRNSLLAEAMVDMSIDVPGLAVSGELLTLSAAQAVENGIADIQAATVQDALQQFGYGGARLTFLEPTLTERISGWLSQPIIAALLLVIGIGGLVIELFTPGFGLPGALGVIGLALFGLTAIFSTPAGTIDMVLFVIGLILIMVEIFVMPGTFVPAILGAAAIVTALIRVFQEQSIAVLGWTTLFASALILGLFWLFPRSRLVSGLRLETRLASGGASAVLQDAPAPVELIGQRGTAQSDLRPSGVARIGGQRVDVVTQGDFIRAGTPIEVHIVEGNRIVVRALESDGNSSGPSGPELNMGA